MGIFDFLGGGGDEGFGIANDNLVRNRGLFEAIDMPEYQEWVPELYQNESIDYDLLTEDPTFKSSQMDVLSKLAGLSETGLSAVDDAAFARARREASGMAKRNTEAVLADAARRGVGSGGMEFALREIGNQEAAERAQQANLDRAAEAAKERALYTQAYGDALQGARGQDMQARQYNTDVINKFNTMNTQARNNVNADNVDRRTDAFKYNEGLKDKRYNNEMGRAERIAGINNQQTDVALAQEEQRRRRRGATMGAIGTGVGAAFGGPTGAMIGSQVGYQMGGY